MVCFRVPDDCVVELAGSLRRTAWLFAENFLHLPDLFLDFPADLLSLAFSLEVGIIRHLPGFIALLLHLIWPDFPDLGHIPLLKEFSTRFCPCRPDARICSQCPASFPSIHTARCNISHPSPCMSSLGVRTSLSSPLPFLSPWTSQSWPPCGRSLFPKEGLSKVRTSQR